MNIVRKKLEKEDIEMTNKEAENVLKNRWPYTCAYPCVSPLECDQETCEVKEATRMAVEALEKTMWVPATERLPEQCTYVLISAYEFISVGRYFTFPHLDEGLWECEYLPDRWLHLNEVNAWMPLPNLYQGGRFV